MKHKLLLILSMAFIPIAMMAYDTINFADAEVKALCVANWDTNGDGELSMAEAAAVANLGEVFKENREIASFDELQFFTGLTSIGDYAFQDCSGLTSVTIPNSVTGIGFDAFQGCSGLTSITIPNSVTGIGDCAFYGCSALTSVAIPSSVTSIGDCAFYGCSALTSINIPNSVTSIGDEAFSGCSSLPVEGNMKYADTYLVEAVDKTLSNYTIKSGTRFIGDYAFSGCEGLTSITIPNSVTSIGGCAFVECYNLTSIAIPNSVTSIGYNAFSSCSSLTSVTVASGNTKYDSRNNCNAIIETSTNTLITGCNNTIIPSSVTSIMDEAFSNRSGLTSITIPDFVTYIGFSAFSECSSLTSITIPNSVTNIGDYAFYRCDGLTSVTIGNSVTGIGEGAFEECYNLTSVTVKNPFPVSISSTTFSNRANATLYVPYGSKSAYQEARYWKKFNTIIEMAPTSSPAINFADAQVKALCVANWDVNGDGELNEAEAAGVANLAMVFVGNEEITSFDELQYFTGLTSIRDYAFQGCTGLTSITIPNSVVSIGHDAFGWSGLTSVTIPNSVRWIGNYPFHCCSDLTSITVASGNTQYDSRDNCNAIIETSTNTLIAGCKNTVIPSSVTSIGKYAFYVCTGLTSITIPSSVTSIGNYAFSGCSSLTSVTVENPTPVSITDATFSNYDATLYVPAGSLAAYQAADYWKEFKTIIEIGATSPTINFADARVKALCVANWDTNGDGELSMAEAAAVANLGEVFEENREITSFDELQYFTGLTGIGDCAFYGCSALTSVAIPSSVTSIGDCAFYGCSALTSINIPNSVRWIGNYPFHCCSDLTSITVASGNTQYDSRDNCNAIIETSTNTLIAGCKNTVIPSSVTSIGNYAFGQCYGLTSVTIPNSVTSIGNYAFLGCDGLTSITIPSSVTSIGKLAFEACNGLTSVTVASGNTKYDSRNNCNAIIETSTNTLIAGFENTIIPSSVTCIGDDAFYGCIGLTSVTIPSSVTSIGENAFSYCFDLTSVTIPSSVTSIGEWAFYNCFSLTSVTVENPSPVSIISFTFSNRANATLYVPYGSKSAYQSADYWKEFKTIIEVDNRPEQTLSLTEIPSMTYGDTDYTLPETTDEGLTLTWTSSDTSVATISGNTLTVVGAGTATITATQEGNNNYKPFSKEYTLTVAKAALTITAKSYTITQGEAMPTFEATYSGFKNNDDETVLTTAPTFSCAAANTNTEGIYDITVSGAVAANYEITYVNGTLTIETLTNPNINFADAQVKALCVANWDTNDDSELSEAEAAAVTDLGEVFKENGEITSFDELQYFTGLTNIGEDAFASCDHLTSVTIPESVTSIGDYAFLGCSGLTSVTIPNSVTSIGDGAFSGCSGLTSVTIPNSVTSIGYYAFSGCDGLTSVTVASGNTQYDSRENCNAIIETSTNTLIVGCKNTIIPNSVSSIGDGAFYGCSGLTSITIPNSVTSIGGEAFNSCSSLTSVTIPNSVRSIGRYAFYDCSGLTSVTIPSSVTSIGYDAFNSCSSLTSITVDVENTIYDSRDNCNAIIETSSNKLIAGCKNTTIPSSVTSIGDGAFFGCSGLTSITIPSSVTSIGSFAFCLCSSLTSITIPSSVTSIGGWAFSSCSSLTSVTVENPSPVTISYSTFSNRANATLYVPYGSKSAYQSANYWKEFKTIIEIDNRQEQTLSLAELPVMIYGDADYTLPETTDEGLTLTWTSGDTSVATISGNTLTVVGVGTATITASQEGNEDYKPFTMEYTLTVCEASTNNTLTVAPVTVFTGSTSTLSISLENEAAMTAFELYLQLPAGVSIADADGDGYPDVTLNSNRANGHNLEVHNDGNGQYHILCYSGSYRAFKGNSGELLSVTLTSDEGLENGTYQGTIHTIKFSDTDENHFFLANVEFDIEVSDIQPGDVNGDTDIDVFDVVTIVSYIMGGSPSQFHLAAADLVPDGVIDVFDLVRLVRLIMDKNFTGANSGSFDQLSGALSLRPCHDGTIALDITGSDRYVASQFIVTLSEGQRLVGVTADDRHTVSYERMADDRYAVMCYSNANETFTSNEGILSLYVTGRGNVAVEEAMFVNTANKRVAFQNILSGYTDGIGSLVIDPSHPTDIYSTSGALVRKAATTTQGLQSGVYIVNGKKAVVN